MDNTDFGRLFKRLRQASGLSQKDLAARVSIDPSYLSHLEAGRREPSIQLVRSLADELKVPAGLLLALLIWSDLPPEQKSTYQSAVENLIELASLGQLDLTLRL